MIKKQYPKYLVESGGETYLSPIRKKFAKYLRKSREEKDLPTDVVLQSHNAILDEVCKRMDIVVSEEDTFKELVSAESIDARPQMKKLLKLVEEGYYDGVLVYEVQRLCRGNGIDQAVVSETFKTSDTKIITPTKVYDTYNNESDEEYLEFGLFMSRREYKTINRRLKDGKVSAFKMGKFINSVPPTGYKRVKLKGDKGFTLEIDETEAPIIREMFNLFVNENMGLSEIARKFENDGVPNRSNTNWSVSMLRTYLNNITYAGYLTYNKRKQVKSLKNGEFNFSRPINKDYMIQKGLHEPIIDINTFNKAQEKLKSNTNVKIPKNREMKNPLAGVIKCSICGKTLIRRVIPKNNHIRIELRCETLNCPTMSTELEEVERKLIETMQNDLKDYKYFLDNYEKEIIKEKKNYTKDIQRIDKQLKDIDKQLLNALLNFNSGAITSDEYQSLKIYLSDKKQALEVSLNELKQRVENDKTVIYQRRVPILEKCIGKYFDLSPKDKNKLLKSMIKRIDYSKTKGGRHRESNMRIEISYKLGVK